MTEATGRSFGEEGGLLTYGSYLRLPQLLAQQVPEVSPPAHDELLFIIVHQAYELWFKQLLHELTAVRDAMLPTAESAATEDDAAPDRQTWLARHLLHRVHVIERLLVNQIDVLETMTPQDFLEFRAALAPASGFQSVQFRELEFLSGAKDPGFVRRFRALTQDEHDRLAGRLAEPSLWDAFVDLLGASGLAVADDKQILASLVSVARDRPHHDDLWQLAEDSADPRRARRAMASQARADGGAADWHQVRDRRLDRCAVPAPASAPALLPVAVGTAGLVVMATQQ